MTVLDNVRIAFNKNMKASLLQSVFRTPYFWKEEAETKEKAMELLKLFKLESFADQYAENLPYGKQRLLEIARALATDMKLLLLDEPAAGMNPCGDRGAEGIHQNAPAEIRHSDPADRT